MCTLSIIVNSYLTVTEKFSLMIGKELFPTFLAHVNVILNLQIQMYIPLRPIPKGDTLLR